MKGKIECLKKEQLAEMVKTLWIERKLRDIDLEFHNYDIKRELAYEELILETTFHIDEKILTYFGYDV